MLLMANKQYKQAESHLSIVVSQHPKNITAQIALARLLAGSGDYKRALTHFQKAFTLNPNYSPDLRIPIGLCFYKLEMHLHAKRAFERAYEKVSFIILSNITF